ncbi:unnamed protein product [Sphagnum balticum]
MLLSCRHINVNARSGRDGWTALHMAACLNFADGVRALIAAGADLYAAATNGKSPLMWAVARNALSCARVLLTAGVWDNDSFTQSTESSSRQSIADAIRDVSVDMMKMLLDECNIAAIHTVCALSAWASAMAFYRYCVMHFNWHYRRSAALSRCARFSCTRACNRTCANGAHQSRPTLGRQCADTTAPHPLRTAARIRRQGYDAQTLRFAHSTASAHATVRSILRRRTYSHYLGTTVVRTHTGGQITAREYLGRRADARPDRAWRQVAMLDSCFTDRSA